MKKTVVFLTDVEFTEISLVDKPANDLSMIAHVTLAKNDRAMRATNGGISLPIVKGEMKMTTGFRTADSALLEGRNRLVKQDKTGDTDFDFLRDLAQDVGTSLFAAMVELDLDAMKRLTTSALTTHTRLSTAIDALVPALDYEPAGAQRNLSAESAIAASNPPAPKMSMGSAICGDESFYKSVRNQLRRPRNMSDLPR
jgi:hypothetical protein